MKNFLFLLLFPLVPCFSYSQIALVMQDGSPISNGQVFTYNTTDESMATLHYKIKNTSANTVKVRIKITGIQNATGSGFQFCYHTTCLPSVSPNAVYPSAANAPISISAGGETPYNGYNMWNSNTGNGVLPITYTIKYYAVDDFNSEYGTPVTITYRYDPDAILATKDIERQQKPFASVPSSIFRNSIDVILKETTTYRISTMDGRILLKGTLTKNHESIETSFLNTGMYIIALQNRNGDHISKKIIKNK